MSLIDKYKELFELYNKHFPELLINIENPIKISSNASEGKHSFLKEERELFTPSNVEGWINLFNEEIKYRTATPKNYNWFKKTYVFSGYPAHNSIESTCRHVDQSKECDICKNGKTSQTFYPNYDEKCTENMIELFHKASDKAITSQGLRDSRFVLSGKAGEGKSAWLNYLLSVKQDFMWEKKLINIKITITDSEFHTEFKKKVDGSKENLDQQIQFIKDWIGLKIIRILKEHYFSCKTTICIEKDLTQYIPSGDTYLKCIPIESRDGEKSFFLTFESGKMTLSIKDAYLKHSTDNYCKECIERLYTKSQFTLSVEEKENIIKKAKDSVAGDDNCLKIVKTDLDEVFERERIKEEVDPRIVKSIWDELIKLGYRFLIIIDGIDPHHNYETSEQITSKIFSSILTLLVKPKVGMFLASYLLATRSETIDRYLLLQSFPGALWGGFNRLQLAKADVSLILQKRLKNAAEKYESEYYKLFSEYFLNITTAHISVSLKTDKKMPEIKEIPYNNIGLDELTLLFRHNKRKILLFYILYMKEIYIALERYNILKESETDPEKDAYSNALKYYEYIKFRPYLFWNSIIYRKKKVYTLIYRYKLSDKDKIIERSIKEGGTTEKENYGTIPNIFDFIIPEGHEQSYPANKILLRLRILQVLDKRTILYKFLIEKLSKYYKLQEEAISWEIDELILMGLIKCADDIQNSNPLLYVTDSWKEYSKHFLSRNPFCGLLPASIVPNISPFLFKEYITFVSIHSRLRLDNPEGRELKGKAYASEFIVFAIMVSYLSIMEDMEKIRYEKHKPNELNELNELIAPTHYVPFEEFSIYKRLKALKDNIIHQTGIYNENSLIQQYVINTLTRECSLTDEEIKNINKTIEETSKNK